MPRGIPYEYFYCLAYDQQGIEKADVVSTPVEQAPKEAVALLKSHSKVSPKCTFFYSVTPI